MSSKNFERLRTTLKEKGTLPLDEVSKMFKTEVDILIACISLEKTGVALVQTDYAITFGNESFGYGAHNGVHTGCGTTTCKNSNCLFHRILCLVF